MATPEGVFADPNYILTLIIGFISGAVVAMLGAWSNHFFAIRRMNDEYKLKKRDKELGIKVELNSKMTEIINYTIASSLLSTQRRITGSNSEKIKVEDDENFKKFLVDANAISLKLGAYFAETDIREKWTQYHKVLLAFRYLSKDYSFDHTTKDQIEGFKFRRETLRKYFSNHDEIDWDRFTTQETFDEELWVNVAQLVSNKGYEIINEVSNLHIKDYYE
jgi:hypothetical protein